MWLSLLSQALFPCGCSWLSRPGSQTYFGRRDVGELLETQVELEDVDDTTGDHPSAAVTGRPRTIADRSRDEIWNLSLMEAIHLALVNNRIARTRNDFLSPGNAVFFNADNVMSVYDPAIRETGFLFGNRGVESALSAFDPVLTASVNGGQNSIIQNNPILSGGIPAGQQLNQDTLQAQAGITKNTATGATLGVQQTWNYNNSNQPFQLFHSVYTGNIQFNFTQPLLAGAGADFVRVSGPLSTNIQGVSGLNQGVLISRINTDMTLIDFEIQIRNMVHDVEDLYWDLYLAYQNYDSLVTARNTALKIWQTVNAKAGTGLKAGGKAEEAQARDSFFEARARAESALGGPAGRGGEQGIYGLELQLRRICGLPTSDGRIIRPSDEPSVAPMLHNWDISLATALSHRQELRRQKWNIKSLEMQLMAAKNLARPQLNFVSQYNINGFGHYLFGDNGPPGTTGADLQNFNRVLYAGNQTGWTVGMQFQMPIGFRNYLAMVRNTEFRLAKARSVLDTQELEVSHDLAGTYQAIDYWWQNVQTNYNRRQAAVENLAAVEAEYDVDRKPLTDVLQSQNRLTFAEMAFYRSVIEYNKSLSEIQLRQGTLLEYNNVHLAEREWPAEAKSQAYRRALARAYAIDPLPVDPVHQEPAPFVHRPELLPAGEQPMELRELPTDLAPYEDMPQPPPAPPAAPPAAPPVPMPAARSEPEGVQEAMQGGPEGR